MLGTKCRASQQILWPSPLPRFAEIGKHEGQTVTIRGWLYNLRESGKLLFPQFRDGSGIIQGVVPKSAVAPEVFESIKRLTQESSVIVDGKVRADKRAPGGYELDVSDVQVVQRVLRDDPYPISLKEHGVDFLMEHRHLWVRTPRQAAILRVRAEIIKAARDFFDERGFTLTDPPILTPAACEGTTTLFPVDYFDEQAYLTQSGQLYIEATAMALGKVYCFGPTFRAEKSKTRRHLTEFWMVEPEVAYADARRSDGSGGGLHQLHRAALPGEAARRLADDWARRFEAGEDRGAVSAHYLRRSGEDAARRRTPRARSRTNSSGAAILARRTRPTFRRSLTSR